MKTLLAFGLASILYVWTTDDGILSFTNMEKRIPQKYRGAVTERTWADVREKTRLKYTPAPQK